MLRMDNSYWNRSEYGSVYVQLVGHSTAVSSIGDRVTVVEYVKYLGREVTLPEAQTEFVSPHMTLMLLMA
jgi:hypothetical protein